MILGFLFWAQINLERVQEVYVQEFIVAVGVEAAFHLDEKRFFFIFGILFFDDKKLGFYFFCCLIMDCFSNGIN